MLDAIKGWSEAGKNLFAVLRDGLLFVLLAMLVGCPKQVNERLAASGMTTVDGPGFHWEKAKEAKDSALGAAAAVEKTKGQNTALIAKIDAIGAADPSLEAKIAPIRAALQQSDDTLAKASDKLAVSIAGQQTVLSDSPADTPPLVGWMYLGAIDAAKANWQGARRSVDGAWPLREGATVKVVDDAYVRVAGAPNARATAAPIGVAKTGKSIVLGAIDTSGRLKAGGFTVWAQVTVPQ